MSLKPSSSQGSPSQQDQQKIVKVQNEDDDLGPSIIMVIQCSDAHLDNILSMASSPVQPGTTAEASKQILLEYLRDLFNNTFKVLVKIQGNNMAVVDNQLSCQYVEIQSQLFTLWDTWGGDCHNAGLSIGTYMVMVGSGRGASTSGFFKVGPFRS